MQLSKRGRVVLAVCALACATLHLTPNPAPSSHHPEQGQALVAGGQQTRSVFRVSLELGPTNLATIAQAGALFGVAGDGGEDAVAGHCFCAHTVALRHLCPDAPPCIWRYPASFVC